MNESIQNSEVYEQQKQVVSKQTQKYISQLKVSSDLITELMIIDEDGHLDLNAIKASIVRFGTVTRILKNMEQSFLKYQNNPSKDLELMLKVDRLRLKLEIDDLLKNFFGC